MEEIKSQVPVWLETLDTLEATLRKTRSPAPQPGAPVDAHSPNVSQPVSSSQTPTASPPPVIAGYTLHHKIGTGSFGVLYAATSPDGQPAAFKFEANSCEAPQLRDEFRTYKALKGCNGVCEAYTHGEAFLHSYMIMEQLGPSLEMLFSKCKRSFSIKTIAMLGHQMVDRLRSIHERNLIYRDLKPQNFLMGPPNTPLSTKLYIIDLGMVKSYIDPINKKHIDPSGNRALTGTVQFLSNNAVRAQAQSRRDDLESLLLVLIYFARDGLPWAQAGSTEAITKMKLETTPEVLCEGLPVQFLHYLKYVRDMAFDAEPDYDYLQSLFDGILTDMGTTNDLQFDWGRLPTVASLRPVLYDIEQQKSLKDLWSSIGRVRYRLARPVRSRRPPPRLSSALAAMAASGNPTGPRPSQSGNSPPPADEQLNKAQKMIGKLADGVLRDTHWPDDLVIIRAALNQAVMLADAEMDRVAKEQAAKDEAAATAAAAAAAAAAEAAKKTPEACHTPIRSHSQDADPEFAEAAARAIAEAAAASPTSSTRVYRRPQMTTRPTSKEGSNSPVSMMGGPTVPMGKGAAPPEPTATALLPKMEDYVLEAAPLEVDDGGEEDEEGAVYVVGDYHNGKKERHGQSLR